MKTGRQTKRLGAKTENAFALFLASLREDYLNQVQRDFLSRPLHELQLSTPLAKLDFILSSFFDNHFDRWT
jgi:hypothetical protein